MTDTPIFMGEWNPNTVYNSAETPAGYTDEVEFEGALWIANYYNIDMNPMWYSEPPGQTTNPYSPGEPGYPWSLAPDNSVNFNTVVPSWAPAQELVNGVLESTSILQAGPVSSSSVSLFWQPAVVLGVGEVSSYDVYATNVSTDVTSLAGTTTSTSFTVSGLSASTQYTFTVDANDSTGTSGNQMQTGTAYMDAYTWNENPGAGPNPTVTVTTDAAQISSGKYFSPYLDMTLPSSFLPTISENSGLKSFTLAFMQTTVDANNDVVLTNGAPSISWGGLGARTTESTGEIIQEVKQVEAEGGTVTISIGGYNGLDAAVYAAANLLTAAELAAEYQSVITTYGVNSLDFDIENVSTVNNYAANKLRDEAIVLLEKANPGLQISYTLATTPNGLATLPAGEADTAANDSADTTSSNDYGVLQQAVADGVKLNVVNIMAMDYYDNVAGEGTTGLNVMGTDAVTAAQKTEAQLTTLGIAGTTKIGITPMIGQNDDYRDAANPNGEVFTLTDAKYLENFAASTSYIAGLGEWELPRDTASATTLLGVPPTSTSSGVVQSAYQFADDLAPIQAITVASVAAFEAVAASATADSYDISDTAANIENGIATLEKYRAYISSVTAASGGKVTVGVSTFLADEAALNKISGGFDIHDLSANIGSNFNALEADVSHIDSVSFSDTSTPILNLTQTQATNDASLLTKVSGSYVLNVSNNGATTTTGHGNGLTIDAVAGGHDTITGGGASETFDFAANFGLDTITDFYQHYTGAGSDLIDLPKAEFANSAAILSDATYNSSGATITYASNGDQLVLQHVTQSILTAATNAGDFKFV